MQADFVFLHGGGQGSWVWNETIAALERQTDGGFGRSLTLDIPGCGTKRDRPTDSVDVSNIISELFGDIDAAGFRDIVLVGHSQAGTILPLLIEARPELFRRVLYVSCVAPLHGQSALNWRSSMPAGNSALMTAAQPGTRERYRQMFCNDMDPESAERFLDNLGPDRWPSSSYAMSEWRYDHLDKLPGTYILCLRDATLIPSWQAIFAERLRARRLISVDAGHQVMNTRPHALAELLRLEAAAVG
jgi:pimeloyl-ACP methyl ester carboxylesterase